MPLSRERDRERKRLSRLESKGVQPNKGKPVQPKQGIVVIGGTPFKRPT